MEDAGAYGGIDAANAVAVWLVVPSLCSYLINLRLPFFPDGGERLLLIVLPYALLLAAWVLDRLWQRYHLGKALLATLSASALAGIFVFYVTPRYVQRDYRPIIAQVVQQGRAGDSFFAIFPWQVGDRRAYVTPQQQAEIGGPQPVLAAEGALVWNDTLQSVLDRVLDAGAVWLPAPLSFGSTLPGEIEAYLSGTAFNLVNRWYSSTTRLSAWSRTDPSELRADGAEFGPVQLALTGVSPASVSAANMPIAVTLSWLSSAADGSGAVEQGTLFVSLRLADETGRVWAARDYTPIGAYSQGELGELTDHVGLIVPVGVPPDRYQLRVGVGISSTGELIYPPFAAVNTDPLLSVASIQVTMPEQVQSAARLPMRYRLQPPEIREGLAFLGYAGIDPDDQVLAGTQLRPTLFLRNETDSPRREIFTSASLTAAVRVLPAGKAGLCPTIRPRFGLKTPWCACRSSFSCLQHFSQGGTA